MRRPRGHSQRPGGTAPHVRLRAVAPGEFDEIPPPLPIHHHPVVSLSLILIVGALVQIGVWQLILRLGNPPGPAASQALVHGLLHDLLTTALARLSGGNGASLAFPIELGLTMLSGWAWFGVARLALGPPWGLWTGLAWVTHPAFAIVANRAGPLGLEILLVSLLAMSLYWWRYRKQPLPAAILIGALLGLLGLTSSVGLLLLPLGFLLVIRAGSRRRRRAWGGLMCVAGAAASVGLIAILAPSQRESVRVRMAADLRTALGSAPATDLQKSQAVPATSPAERSVTDFLSSVRRSPWAHVRWHGGRLLKSVYATADRRFERPLLALQLAWTLPAAWGAVIAARYPPWRWLLAVAVCFVASVWLFAALLEPLARNLTPIGGFGIVFGLIGWADAYERFFGRRLLESRPGC